MATAKKTDKKSPKTETATKAAETTEKDEKVLKIGRDVAAKLLRTMGFKDTHKYSNEILERRLNLMKEYVANYDGTLDGDTQELVDKVIAAKGHIKITGDEPKGAKKDSSEKKPTDKKSTNGKAKAPKEKKVGVKKTAGAVRTKTGELDVFGTPIGSRNAEANKMLSKKPIKMSEIKIKLGGTFYDHFNALVEKGLVEKSGDGYSIKK